VLASGNQDQIAAMGGQQEISAENELAGSLASAQVTLQHLLEGRIKAVEDIGSDAASSDPTPLHVDLAFALSVAALGAASAVIAAEFGPLLAMTALAESVGPGLLGRALTDGPKLLMDKELAKVSEAGLKQGLFGSGKGKGDFFRGQRRGLEHIGQRTVEIFAKQKIRFVEGSEDPVALADALQQALAAMKDPAYDAQYEETLSAWCTYQARIASGVANEEVATEGTDLLHVLGDTSAKGVLGLVVESAAAGGLEIVDAEIEGLNGALRARLGARRLGDLRIPITAHGPVELPDERGAANGILRIGRGEGGGLWNHSPGAAEEWLAWKGGAPPASDSYRGQSAGEVASRKPFVHHGVERVFEEEILPACLDDLHIPITDNQGYD
jgi:hypothetical protein